MSRQLTNRNRKCPARAAVGLAMALLLTPAATAAAEPQRYAVRAFGVRIGELTLDTREAGGAYAASARFRTTGLAGALAHVRFDMRSEGKLHPHLAPLSYVEQVETGRRSSDATLTFGSGGPTLSGGRAGAEGPAVPARLRRNTVDPMTALFAALRPRPRSALCDLDLAVFDGARLNRLTLARASEQAGTITCAGRFDRHAGYPPEEMARQPGFTVSLIFSGPQDRMQATRAEVETVHGPVTLILR